MSAAPVTPPALFVDRLRAATALLESIAADRGVLSGVPEDDFKRFLRAVFEVRNPPSRTRRRLQKSVERAHRAARVRRDETVRSSSAIRSLHRRPVSTTPNAVRPVFPVGGFAPRDIHHGHDGPGGSGNSGSPGSPGRDDRSDNAPREILDPQACYVCKARYSTIHPFYDQLCPSCADLNFTKRTETADLRGRVALLTGGRVKIGYQTGLKLLRAGAALIVTTRFPRDSATRYAKEPDFHEWADRLSIFGLDLRHTPSVEAFCREMVETQSRLDFIINNACQTVRRPPDFYTHMMAGEVEALTDMPAHVRQLLGAYARLRGRHGLPESSASVSASTGEWLERRIADVAGLTHAPELSQVRLLPEELRAQADLFPQGLLDQDQQQVDLRGRNSWRLLLDEVPTVELLEVQLVNAVAPFVLNARLKPLMLRTPERDKHVVNVSAVEGQFYRSFKTTRHPHTNMAKAALNMMTRTAAADYHADGIHMNSVDTGWVTDEDAAEIAARKTAELRFHPPLDIVDGAARVVDPIISGINTGAHVWGQFLKDYKPTDW